MDGSKASPMSGLFVVTAIDVRDEWDERLEKCYTILQGVIGNIKSEKEVHDILNVAVSKGVQQHEEISVGLLVSILIDPPNTARYYRDLTLVTRDGLQMLINRLNQVVLDKYPKFQDVPRNQLIWLIKEMIKNNVQNVDTLCNNLLRQIAGGDISNKNVWLAENMLDMFIEHRAWLEKFPLLVATVVYTYLRLIVDHGSPAQAVLRQREVDLTVSLIRDKFLDCLAVGRDLVRLLQNVARIPEFEKLWKDILWNPANLSPGFTGLLQMMTTRTSRRFLQSRLTPDMEKKVYFLTSQVRFGNHKRYQEWFQKQYLATAESQSLRCDLIRFIIGVIHPTNELLCSDIIPRWAVIGWLLTTCTSNVAASNAKLSLCYDWLFFDPEKDNIMNIEPAILVMNHSMRTHPAITATLVDFLCRIIPNFHPPLADKVRQGIHTSLRQILEKRVLPTLSPLFDNPKLDKELRCMIRETFSEFCSPIEAKIEESLPASPARDMAIAEVEGNHLNMSNNSSDHEAEFSDDEDDIPLAKMRLRDLKFKPIKENPTKLEPVAFSEYLDQLEENFKLLILRLQDDKDNESRCEVMESLVQAVMQEVDLDQESAALLATCIDRLLSSQFTQRLFPQELDDESIEDSLGTPLFVMFRNLCQTSEEDPSRQPILMLLAEMYGRQPKLGYHLLYFIKASKVQDDKMTTYRDFCKSLESKDLESCLLHDLRLCQDDDVRLFCYLIPDIYIKFPNIAIGSAELLNLIVSCIDSTQLQALICSILQGNMKMFLNDSFLSILNASLEWETFEQYCLWQLIAAHNIPVNYILPILPRLEFAAHAEALTSILLLLKQEKPTAELLKHIMCREVKVQDLFVVSVLKYWLQEHEEKLAELMATQLGRFNTTPNKRKRQQHNKPMQGPTIEQMMAHLDQLRQNCKQTSFFNHEVLQQSLLQIQISSSEALKTKFSDLFSLAEEMEEGRTSHIKSRGGRKTTLTTNKTGNKVKHSNMNYSDTSEDSSEDDEILKPRSSKKRKRAAALGSDSD